MKYRLMTTVALAGILGGAVAFTTTSAVAHNSAVESTLVGYSDVSSFYAALLNTGVLSQLDENTHYTIFAPTNEAFAQIRPEAYPCFYAVQCRAQLADVMRDHIVADSLTLDDLVKYVHVPTIGRYRLYAESPYIGDYTVAGHRILSHAEVRGNMIYRIDGVIMSDEQLAQFRVLPPVANAVLKEKTITTYRVPASYVAPGGAYPAGTTETVTEKTYVTPASVPSTTVVYPDGTETTTTTARTYIAPVAPDAFPDESDNGGETTTVTRTITTQP